MTHWVSGSKIPSSDGSHCRFDSVAKHPECTDHSRGADSVGPFAHGETAFLIANTVVQDDPDQVLFLGCPRKTFLQQKLYLLIQ